LKPQSSWDVNDPSQLKTVLSALGQVQEQFHRTVTGNTRVSMADLIVLGGCAALEKAAAEAGYTVTVPFHPGRMDASPDQTDTASFNVLKPLADGFRNWQRKGLPLRAEELLVDRAQLLGLSAPEMTVLIAGLRVLGANSGGSRHGVLTDRIGVLSNDFCVNLLDMTTHWTPVDDAMESYIGCDGSGQKRWTASRADLVFGSNSQLRAIVEIYAQDDGGGRFVDDFVRAWVKVMNLDRFDLH
jgi:catalase-peroxidase